MRKRLKVKLSGEGGRKGEWVYINDPTTQLIYCVCGKLESERNCHDSVAMNFILGCSKKIPAHICRRKVGRFLSIIHLLLSSAICRYKTSRNGMQWYCFYLKFVEDFSYLDCLV